MTVGEFNTDKGIYIFDFDRLDTAFHSHPAVEIIIAKSGSFTLCTKTQVWPDLKFAVVAANQPHRLLSVNQLKIFMIEHHNRFIGEHLAFAEMALKNGFFFQQYKGSEETMMGEMVEAIKQGQALAEYDERVAAAIMYLNKNSLEYGVMMKTLQSITLLSESRLSHLFKSNVGISLKKYLIWTKLRSAISQHLNQHNDLLSALIGSGFYDQPHFSKNFKHMLGIQPSKAYK